MKKVEPAAREHLGTGVTAIRQLGTYSCRNINNRDTGRRVHRAKAEAEHLERQDEALRILTDEQFAQIAERIGKAARGQMGRTGNGIALFTGLVFCPCGARCSPCTSSAGCSRRWPGW